MLGFSLLLPTANRVCSVVMLGNGLDPVNISTIKQPTLQMSLLRDCPDCRTTSGAIQKTEPCRDVRVPGAEFMPLKLVFFETPKSDILTIPRLSTRMLAPLMSR